MKHGPINVMLWLIGAGCSGGTSIVDVDSELKALEDDHDLTPIERFERFGVVLRTLEEQDPRHQRLLWEWVAWALHLRGDAPETIRRGEWFGPLAEWPAGDGRMQEIPDPTLFTAEMFEHLAERAHSTTNPEVAVRFADVVWERRRSTGDYPYARLAFENYLLLARRRMARPVGTSLQNPALIVAYARRAAMLALQLRNDQFLTDAAVLYRELLASPLGEPLGIGSMLQVIEQAIPLMREGRLSEGDLLQSANRVYENATSNGDTQNYACEVIAKVEVACGRAEEARASRLRGAESLERQADFFRAQGPEAALIALAWYQKAAERYVSLGAEQNRIEAVKQKMAETGVESLPAMKPISASVQIPREPAEEIVREITSLSTNQGAILALVNSTWAIPNIARDREFISNVRRHSIVAMVTTPSVLDDEGLSHTLSAAEAEKYDFIEHVMRRLIMYYHLLVAPILAKLRVDRGLNAGEIMAAIAS